MVDEDMATQAHDYLLDHERDPPLHQVAFNGDIQRLQELLKMDKYRAQVNHINRLGCTPLRLAATRGHERCVEALLQNGAALSVDATDLKAQTPLFVAVKNGHFGTAELLLRLGGAHPDGHAAAALCTPLYYAAMDGRADLVRLLLRHGARQQSVHVWNGCNTTPMHVALTYHRFHCARLMLLAGADPDGHQWPHLSVFHRPPLFLRPTSQPSPVSPASPAASPSTASSASIASSVSSSPPSSSSPMVVDAALTNNSPDAESHSNVHIPKPPSSAPLPSAPRTGGDPLLHMAVKYNCEPKFVQLLFEFGANLYSRDARNRFAWQMGVENKASQLLRLLAQQPRTLQSACRVCFWQLLRNGIAYSDPVLSSSSPNTAPPLQIPPRPHRIDRDLLALQLKAVPLADRLISYLMFDTEEDCSIQVEDS